MPPPSASIDVLVHIQADVAGGLSWFTCMLPPSASVDELVHTQASVAGGFELIYMYATTICKRG